MIPLSILRTQWTSMRQKIFKRSFPHYRFCNTSPYTFTLCSKLWKILTQIKNPHRYEFFTICHLRCEWNWHYHWHSCHDSFWSNMNTSSVFYPYFCTSFTFSIWIPSSLQFHAYSLMETFLIGETRRSNLLTIKFRTGVPPPLNVWIHPSILILI